MSIFVNAEQHKENTRIVSVLFTRAHRRKLLAKVCEALGSRYTHVSISYDENFNTFYSFDFNGFREDHPAHRKGYGKTSVCYQFSIASDEYELLVDRIKSMRTAGSQFNVIAYILAGIMHLPLTKKWGSGYICSEFVAEQLMKAHLVNLPLDPCAYFPGRLEMELKSQPALYRILVDEL